MRARVSAFLLVLYAVGFSFLPFSAIAETIVLPDPLYTNQFTTVEAWVQLHSASAWVMWEDDDLDDFYYYVNEIISSANSLYSEFRLLIDDVYEYSTIVSQLQGDLEYNLPEDSDIWDNDEFLELWENIFDFYETKSRSLQQDAYQTLYSASNNVDRVVSIVTQLRDRVQYTNVVTSVEFGQEYGRILPSGGCECPDYTVYLQGLYAVLYQWRQTWTQQFSDLLADVEDLHTQLDDIFRGMRSRFTSNYNIGVELASLMAQYKQGYIYPTNEITNPLWVALTNANPLIVQIDENQLPLPVSFGDAEFLVAVTNFDELVFMLTNQDSVETRSEAEFNFAESKLRNQDQPDEEDDDLEDVSLDDLDEIGTKLQEITESYKEMFDTNLVPTEMPNSIVLHQGYRLGPITVSSMHWNPDSKTGRLLRGMRSLFRAFWFVIYLVLLYYCAAIDMLVAGALLSCCFGVLMGKPEKITTGISRVWRLFVSMLGVSPSSSE